MYQEALEKACIEYKTKFLDSELQEVKLTQTFDDGTKLSKMYYDTGTELFDAFEDCLQGTAEAKWQNITAGIPQNQRMVARFNQAITDYHLCYVKPTARDTMKMCLPTCKKPYSVESAMHVDRMETLFRYTNRLPGTVPELTEQEQKNIIFYTFPLTWQQSHVCAGKNLVTDSMVDIQAYMSNKKVFADGQDNKKRKSNNGNGGNSSNKKGNRDKKDGKGQPKAGDPCPAPWHHGRHTWGQCCDNIQTILTIVDLKTTAVEVEVVAVEVEVEVASKEAVVLAVVEVDALVVVATKTKEVAVPIIITTTTTTTTTTTMGIKITMATKVVVANIITMITTIVVAIGFSFCMAL